MCGIVSIDEYEDLAARPKGEYGSYEIVDRFTGPRNRKGIIVRETDIIPANFFGEGEPERRSVSVWAILNAKGTQYQGFWGADAEDNVEQAQAYMIAQGFKKVTPATQLDLDLELTEADEEAVLQEISHPAPAPVLV